MKNPFRFRFLILVFILALILANFSCKKNYTDYVPVKNTFSLGVILPMDNENGPPRENSLRTAIDEINHSGGIGNGYSIQLIVKSDAGTDREAAAIAAAGEIVAATPDLVGFITTFSSSSRGVVTMVAEPGHYPVISGSATATSLSGISTWFQRLAPTDDFEATILTAQARAFGIPTVAVAIEEGDAYSEGLATRFINEFGTGIICQVKFKKKDPDLEAKCSLLLAGSPAAIFLSMISPDVYNPLILKLSEINSWKAPLNMHFILCDALHSSSLFQSPLDFMIGEINGFPKNFGAMPSPDTSSSIYKFFSGNLEIKFHQKVGSYNAQYYDAAYIYALAMQKAIRSTGLADMKLFRETVNAQIRTVSRGLPGDPPVMPNMGWKAMKAACDFGGVNYDGASGNCNIDDSGNVVTPYAVFKIIKQGGFFFFQTIGIIKP